MQAIEVLPPHDEAAEKAVIGCAFIDPTLDTFHDLRHFLGADPGVFFGGRRRAVWEGMCATVDAGGSLDAEIIRDHMTRAGTWAKSDDAAMWEAVNDCVSAVAAPSRALEYARIVMDKYRLRLLLQACHETVADVDEGRSEPTDTLNEAVRRVSAIAEQCAVAAATDAATALDEAMEEFRRPAAEGFKTGIPTLDEITSIGPGQLIAVGARTKIGKSCFLTSIADRWVNGFGHTVLLFSFEMYRTEIIERLITAYTGISSRLIQNMNNLPENLVKEIEDCGPRIRRVGKRLRIFDRRGVTVEDVVNVSRVEKRKHGVDAVIVDYLQLLRPSRHNYRDARYVQVGHQTAALKNMAGELGVPVLLACQMGRQAEDRAPELSDYRESGNIEQDADGCWALHRDRKAMEGESSAANIGGQAESQEAEIHVLATRRDGSGVAHCTFNAQRMIWT